MIDAKKAKELVEEHKREVAVNVFSVDGSQIVNNEQWDRTFINSLLIQIYGEDYFTLIKD